MGPSASLFVMQVVSFLLQLLFFCAIPFLVFVIGRRTVRGFPAWIGLKRAPVRAVVLAAGIAAVLAAIQLPLMRAVLEQEGTVTGELLDHHEQHGWTVWLIATLLVTAWGKTALTEEIFFRGFVAARLIARLGFAWGNAIQAILFGAVHLALVTVMPAEQRTAALAAMVFVVPALAGWIMGYMNSRHADGSILPSWVMHGLGNTIAYTVPLVLARAG